MPRLISFFGADCEAQVCAMAGNLHIFPHRNGSIESLLEGVEAALVQREYDAFLVVEVESRDLSEFLKQLL